ncbi:DNA polymerase III subunit chi [Roseitranquillus sediminis]|uniref:DNA polymerase III subunit chi n=1 Tax=Roseitranquillus sediminis TaxID=2809051 RepID=UPI001D0BF90D|nr:DNA polymerase III subunit chi [Roseitranquillus sediminis]MBM9594373.1 DNA polymerase III subunit chi [Roseitranquillus sediminis]
MGAAFFYHLTRSPLEATLPALIEKARGQGWRVVVRGRTDAVVERLDRMLWENPADSFLPHGLAGGPYDDDQPVLLTVGGGLANRAACLMTIEGADVSPDEVETLERTCILFDGADEAAVETARAQWRSLTTAGLAAEYWAQGEAGWRRQSRVDPRERQVAPGVTGER